MQLYAGSSTQFIEDAFLGAISEKLKRSFFDHFRYQPSPNEVQSWQNSLARMSVGLQRADLPDHGVVSEHQLLLLSKLLDCLVVGQDGAGQDQAVVVGSRKRIPATQSPVWRRVQAVACPVASKRRGRTDDGGPCTA